ncbi:MAG: hypothetical protein ABFD60_01720 [Bryobacteraceae bacterium]
MPSVYRPIPKALVHVVRTLHPAHLRYYTIAGFVVEDLGDSWRVMLAGQLDMRAVFIGVALCKKGR